MSLIILLIADFCLYDVLLPVLLLFMILNSHQMSPNFLVLSFSKCVNSFVSFTGQGHSYFGLIYKNSNNPSFEFCM